MWTHRLAMTLLSLASTAVLAQAPPPMPVEDPGPSDAGLPRAQAAGTPVPREDALLEEAVRIIPQIAKRSEQVIDGKRVVHVTTEAGREYELIEEDGVVVTTLLQSESERLRVPLWRLFEW